MADRVKMIRAIKAAQRTLCLDDATYRAVLMSATGKDSCSKMTEKELGKTLSYFRSSGFHSADDPETRRQRGLITAIWQEMAFDGMVKNSSAQAMNAYVRRICKGSDLEELTVQGCSRVIESLKRWVRREGSQALVGRVFNELCSTGSH